VAQITVPAFVTIMTVVDGAVWSVCSDKHIRIYDSKARVLVTSIDTLSRKLNSITLVGDIVWSTSDDGTISQWNKSVRDPCCCCFCFLSLSECLLSCRLDAESAIDRALQRHPQLEELRRHGRGLQGVDLRVGPFDSRLERAGTCNACCTQTQTQGNLTILTLRRPTSPSSRCRPCSITMP